MRRALVRSAAAARAIGTATAAATDGSALRRFRSTLAPPVATATTAATLDKPAAFARRLRTASSSPPASDASSAPRHHKKPVRPRLRVADARVGALLASRTPPADFVALCAELRGESEVALLAATDSTAWNVALQNRLRQHDAAGARALLDLLLGFAPENASEQLWSDLLFTLLRQRAHFSQERDVRALLATLRGRSSGDAFVARVVVSLVNGCANIKMFDEARFLVRFYAEHLQQTAELPPRVLGHLASAMQAKRRFAGVVEFADELLAAGGGGAVPLRHVQPQVWIALFRSCEQTRATDLARHVDRVLDWFHALQQEPVGALKDQPPPAFERVLGAAVQSCVASGNERLALRVFHVMTENDDDEEEEDGAASDRAVAPHAAVVRPDENIYVNVLKACLALHDDALFRDVYRRMARAGVARSAGFGSAIRFCHAHHDVAFLEEVLEDAFAVEDASSATSRSQARGHGKRSHNDGWFLPLEQYNDALGCFAETKSFDLAKELFARLLENPRVAPDEITMVEMVENYREAPFSDVFELMEVFLELQVSPNLHVFTSLLAACGRHRLINDALALLSAMKAQGVALDVKAFTALAFVYATHGHLPGLVDVLQDVRAQRVAVDDKFFDVLLDGLYDAHGIDMCFALLRETLAAGLAIPAGMYGALLRIGTRAGLVERTLHIAYNMECDGIPITSAQLLALMRRCEANAEVAELARTFLLLHQGRQALSPDDPHARFSQDVYEEMVALLSAFSQRDIAARVRQLGERAGYDLS